MSVGNRGGNRIGYFTEIEQLQNRIRQLEEQLCEEREEHKAIYAKMKRDVQEFIQENMELKKENMRLAALNASLIAEGSEME